MQRYSHEKTVLGIEKQVRFELVPNTTVVGYTDMKTEFLMSVIQNPKGSIFCDEYIIYKSEEVPLKDLHNVF